MLISLCHPEARLICIFVTAMVIAQSFEISHEYCTTANKLSSKTSLKLPERLVKVEVQYWFKSSSDASRNELLTLTGPDFHL